MTGWYKILCYGFSVFAQHFHSINECRKKIHTHTHTFQHIDCEVRRKRTHLHCNAHGSIKLQIKHRQVFLLVIFCWIRAVNECVPLIQLWNADILFRLKLQLSIILAGVLIALGGVLQCSGNRLNTTFEECNDKKTGFTTLMNSSA